MAFAAVLHPPGTVGRVALVTRQTRRPEGHHEHEKQRRVIVGLIVGIVAGGAVGGAVVLVVSSGRLSKRVAALHFEHVGARAATEAEVVRLSGLLDRERATMAERQATHEEARELAAGVFAELSTKALEQNNAQFASVARVN